MKKAIITLIWALPLVLLQPVIRPVFRDGQPADRAVGVQAAEPTPTPTYDPLKEPVLPDNPSQVEYGSYLYYYHCMPCHGDLGQGLTDDFRKVWVEDHQDCWNRGCHGGRPKDEGFPIPTYIPPVIAENDALKRFSRFEDLQAYLRKTHPPQRPGKLAAAEYAALAAYLWSGNQKPEIQSAASSQPTVLSASTPAAFSAEFQPAQSLGGLDGPGGLPANLGSTSLRGKNNPLLVLGGGLLLLFLTFLAAKMMPRRP